jgi:MFS transporter, DHA1 family, multidrug resistance protein
MSEPVRPTVDLLLALTDDRRLDLTEPEIEAAHAMHVRYRDELERLRAVRLQYLPPYVEPATALAWIERGGRST